MISGNIIYVFVFIWVMFMVDINYGMFLLLVFFWYLVNMVRMLIRLYWILMFLEKVLGLLEGKDLVFVFLLDKVLGFLRKFLGRCMRLLGELVSCVFLRICIGEDFKLGCLFVGMVFILLVCFIIRWIGLKFDWKSI